MATQRRIDPSRHIHHDDTALCVLYRRARKREVPFPPVGSPAANTSAPRRCASGVRLGARRESLAFRTCSQRIRQSSGRHSGDCRPPGALPTPSTLMPLLTPPLRADRATTMTRHLDRAPDERRTAPFGLSLCSFLPVLLTVLSVPIYAQGTPCPSDSSLPRPLQEWPVALCILGSAITFAEYIGGLLMLGWTFRVAIRVKAGAFPVAASPLPEGSFQTENVKARYVAPNQWLFRHKQRPFDFQTPLQVRGVAWVDDGRLVLEGRQEWGALLFFAGFAVLTAPLMGPVAALAMVGFSVVYQRARFRDDCREVVWKLAGVVP